MVKNFVLIYIFFFSKNRGKRYGWESYIQRLSSFKLKDRKVGPESVKISRWSKQRLKITMAGAGSTSGSVCIYCGYRSVSKASLSREIVVRREKEGLRAKRKRKAFLAVGNERGIERRGRGWVTGRWWGIPWILDPAPFLDPWISLGATVYSNRLLSLSHSFSHLDRFKCFVRVSDSNHRRTKRYELVFARLVLFTRDSATDLEQKRLDNGCRCKYCNARGECNCVVEQRRNIMVDRERCVLFECSIDLNVGASGFLCPLLWCPQ